MSKQSFLHAFPGRRGISPGSILSKAAGISQTWGKVTLRISIRLHPVLGKMCQRAPRRSAPSSLLCAAPWPPSSAPSACAWRQRQSARGAGEGPRYWPAAADRGLMAQAWCQPAPHDPPLRHPSLCFCSQHAHMKLRQGAQAYLLCIEDVPMSGSTCQWKGCAA